MLERLIAEVEHEIELLLPYAAQVELLDTPPGVNRATAAVISAEVAVEDGLPRPDHLWRHGPG